MNASRRATGPLPRRTPLLTRLALALSAAAALQLQTGARAADIEVPCADDAVSAAMAQANANGEDDVLLLAPECPYILPETMVVGPDGGSRVTVEGRGATLSGNIQRTPIRVLEGARLHLIEVTVRDGAGYGLVAGGIHVGGELIFERSALAANSSQNAGGGIWLVDEVGARLVTINSTFLGNGSPYGGAVYVGLYASAEIVSSTFTDNIADHGAAIFSVGGVLHFENSILANSQPGVDCSYAGFVPVTASGANLIEADACAVPGVLSGDPKLGLPTGNPVYYPLLPDSPAVDAGGTECPAVDQRNLPRPQDGNKDGVALCDLGAVERAKSACGLLGIEAFLVLPLARRLARRAAA
jgi:hypothetical protein